MENEWKDYDPNDPSTHPGDNTRVQIKFSNGRQFSGVYSRAAGFFAHVGIIPEDTVNLPKRWRYLTEAARR